MLSPGCTNCYAMAMAARTEAMGISRYDGLTRKVNGHSVWTGKIARAPRETLLAPLKRKKPTTYFVNSMGDLFHEGCSDEWIDEVFAVMALCPQHTFQVLTKRADRMRDYMLAPDRKRTIAAQAMPISCMLAREGGHEARIKLDHFSVCFAGAGPLRNVWLGVSAERQEEADKRIPLLLQTPAAVRFVSCEPLLGEIRLNSLWVPENKEWFSALKGIAENCGHRRKITMLDWVIVGGESGPHARPMHPDWTRSLRDQCRAAGVSFFFKQWGAWAPSSEGEWCADDGSHRHMLVALDGRHGDTVADLLTKPKGTAWMRRLGKHAAERVLDGVIHDAMPERGS